MDALFLFITTALPKAGAQFGSVPLTANIVFFALLVGTHPFRALRSIRIIPGIIAWYVTFAAIGLLSLVLALGSGLESYDAAQRLVVIFSPLAVVAASRIDPDRAARILAVALILTSVYALVQFLIGISATAIPGLTYTYGQSLETKPIGYQTLTGTAAKMPSTYQNGNSFGIFCALGVALMLVWRPTDPRWRRSRLAAIVAGLLGLALCGSRSIIIPFAAVATFLLWSYSNQLPSRQREVSHFTATMVALLAISTLLALEPSVFTSFWNRNVIHTLADPTASGRTGQWSAMARGIAGLTDGQFLRLLAVGQDPSYGLGGEGLPAFFVTFGLPATLLFYGLLLIVTVRCWTHVDTRPLTLALLSVVAAFCVDTTFFYPPNLMIFFLIAAIGIRVVTTQRDTDSTVVTRPMTFRSH